MELGHVFTPLEMTHEEATLEILKDMLEDFDSFNSADLETMMNIFTERIEDEV